MKFEWDDKKNQSNIYKHGISFDFAKRIFNADVITAVDERFNYGETRNISIGKVEGVLTLVVVHTERGSNTIRIISARKANQSERFRYEEALR